MISRHKRYVRAPPRMQPTTVTVVASIGGKETLHFNTTPREVAESLGGRLEFINRGRYEVLTLDYELFTVYADKEVYHPVDNREPYASYSKRIGQP